MLAKCRRWACWPALAWALAAAAPTRPNAPPETQQWDEKRATSNATVSDPGVPAGRGDDRPFLVNDPGAINKLVEERDSKMDPATATPALPERTRLLDATASLAPAPLPDAAGSPEPVPLPDGASSPERAPVRATMDSPEARSGNWLPTSAHGPAVLPALLPTSMASEAPATRVFVPEAAEDDASLASEDSWTARITRGPVKLAPGREASELLHQDHCDHKHCGEDSAGSGFREGIPWPPKPPGPSRPPDLLSLEFFHDGPPMPHFPKWPQELAMPPPSQYHPCSQDNAQRLVSNFVFADSAASEFSQTCSMDGEAQKAKEAEQKRKAEKRKDELEAERQREEEEKEDRAMKDKHPWKPDTWAGEGAGATRRRRPTGGSAAWSDGQDEAENDPQEKEAGRISLEKKRQQEVIEKISRTLACSQQDISWEPLDMTAFTVEENVAECQERCKRTTGCAHFSYWLVGDHCHLQDAFAKPTLSKWGFVSGPPGCLDGRSKDLTALMLRKKACLKEDTSSLPLDSPGFTPVVEPQIEACQKSCQDHEGCASFTYNHLTRICHLQRNGTATVRNMDMHVSGPRKCRPWISFRLDFRHLDWEHLIAHLDELKTLELAIRTGVAHAAGPSIDAINVGIVPQPATPSQLEVLISPPNAAQTSDVLDALLQSHMEEAVEYCVNHIPEEKYYRTAPVRASLVGTYEVEGHGPVIRAYGGLGMLWQPTAFGRIVVSAFALTGVALLALAGVALKRAAKGGYRWELLPAGAGPAGRPSALRGLRVAISWITQGFGTHAQRSKSRERHKARQVPRDIDYDEGPLLEILEF